MEVYWGVYIVCCFATSNVWISRIMPPCLRYMFGHANVSWFTDTRHDIKQTNIEWRMAWVGLWSGWDTIIMTASGCYSHTSTQHILHTYVYVCVHLHMCSLIAHRLHIIICPPWPSKVHWQSIVGNSSPSASSRMPWRLTASRCSWKHMHYK